MDESQLNELKARREEWRKERLGDFEERRAAAKEAGKKVAANPVQRALLNPTRQRLIEANCYLCVGGGPEMRGDPNPHARVRECTVFRCIIWPHRPWQDAKGHSGYVDEKADSDTPDEPESETDAENFDDEAGEPHLSGC